MAGKSQSFKVRIRESWVGIQRVLTTFHRAESSSYIQYPVSQKASPMLAKLTSLHACNWWLQAGVKVTTALHWPKEIKQRHQDDRLLEQACLGSGQTQFVPFVPWSVKGNIVQIQSDNVSDKFVQAAYVGSQVTVTNFLRKGVPYPNPAITCLHSQSSIFFLPHWTCLVSACTFLAYFASGAFLSFNFPGVISTCFSFVLPDKKVSYLSLERNLQSYSFCP